MNKLHDMSIIGLPNYSITKNGQVFSHFTNKWIAQNKDYKGYIVLSLSLPDGRSVPQKLHRLLAMMFIPNPFNKEQVNHKNGIKDDPTLSNLEWVDHLENGMHAVHSGLYPQNQINEELAHLACQLLEKGWKVKAVAQRLNVPYGTISSITLRKSWCHVSSKYDIPPINLKGPELTETKVILAEYLMEIGISVPGTAKFLRVSESRINMLRYEKMYGKKE